jgi:hypothetical protein
MKSELLLLSLFFFFFFFLFSFWVWHYCPGWLCPSMPACCLVIAHFLPPTLIPTHTHTHMHTITIIIIITIRSNVDQPPVVSGQSRRGRIRAEASELRSRRLVVMMMLMMMMTTGHAPTPITGYVCIIDQQPLVFPPPIAFPISHRAVPPSAFPPSSSSSFLPSQSPISNLLGLCALVRTA